MAKLDITITKDAFESLDEKLKGYYVANGDKYELEGIGAIQRAHDADKDRLTKFSGLNPEEAKKAVETLKALGVEVDAETLKEALDTQRKAKEKKLIDKGDYDSALALKQQEYDNQLAPLKNENSTFRSAWVERELDMQLIEAGVLPDRVRYARSEVAPNTEVVIEDGKPTVRLKSGIGDLATAVSKLKESSPFLFAASGASGSGASGSQQQGGNAKTMPEAQFDSLSPQEQASFVKGGGTVT